MREVLEAFSRPTTLLNAAHPLVRRFPEALDLIRQLRELGLLISANQPAFPPLAVANTLSVWLHMTERCSLRCHYCYLPTGGRDLSLKMGQNALEQAFKTAAARGLRTVKLKYAGGEPTLRFDTVLALDDYAQALSAASGLGLERVLLSNGYTISEEMAATLRDRKIVLSVSLDGLGEYQDNQRQTPDGRPTSARVLQTLERLTGEGLVPRISITVSHRNLPGLPDMLAFALEHGYPFHINFYRENPYSHGSASLNSAPDELIAGMRAAYQVVEAHLPEYPLTGALLDRVRLDLPHDRPCGAGLNYVVVRPDGSLTACQMLEQPSGSLSTVEDRSTTPGCDLLSASAGEPPMPHSLPVYKRGSCVECPWQFACGGGCPLLTFRATGRWDAPSPYCEVYRVLIPAVLRLEGLRMRKFLSAQN